MARIVEFNKWLKNPEGLHLEFKAARNGFDRNKLSDYCAALTNKGGGKLLLGVENKPHKVVGSMAFEGTYNTLPHDLLNTIKIRVDVEELLWSGGAAHRATD